MKLTTNELKKIREAKNVEELILWAREAGFTASEELIKAKYDEIHNPGALSDEELANVSGGDICSEESEPEEEHLIKSRLVCLNKACTQNNQEWWYIGDVRHRKDIICVHCGSPMWVCSIYDFTTSEQLASECWAKDLD